MTAARAEWPERPMRLIVGVAPGGPADLSTTYRIFAGSRLTNVEARVSGKVSLEVVGPVTQRAILDALEAQYPMLRGTIRDVMFLGSTVRLRMRLGDGTPLLFDTFNNPHLSLPARGDAVTVSFPSEACP